MTSRINSVENFWGYISTKVFGVFFSVCACVWVLPRIQSGGGNQCFLFNFYLSFHLFQNIFILFTTINFYLTTLLSIILFHHFLHLSFFYLVKTCGKKSQNEAKSNIKTYPVATHSVLLLIISSPTGSLISQKIGRKKTKEQRIGCHWCLDKSLTPSKLL